MWSVASLRREPSTASRMCCGRLSRPVILPVLDAEAELRREDHLVATALECAPEEFLVMEGAVDLRGVEEVEPELDCAVDGSERLGVVARAVRLAHAHASQAEGGNLEALLPKSTLHHCCASPALAGVLCGD